MAKVAVSTTALFTLATWSTSVVPSASDFTTDEIFDTTTGFSSVKYTAVWSQPSTATAFGSDAAAGTATTANSKFIW